MKKKFIALLLLFVLLLQTMEVSAAGKISLYQTPYKNYSITKEKNAGFDLTYVCDGTDNNLHYPCFITGQSKLSLDTFYKAFILEKKKDVMKDDLFHYNIVEKSDSQLVFEVHFDPFFPWPYLSYNDFSYVNYDQYVVIKTSFGIQMRGTSLQIPAGFNSEFVTYVPNKDLKDKSYSSKNVKLDYDAINKAGREALKKNLPSKIVSDILTRNVTLANIEDNYDEYSFKKEIPPHVLDDDKKYQFLNPQAKLTKKLKNGLYVQILMTPSELVSTVQEYNDYKTFVKAYNYGRRYETPKPPVPKMIDYKTYKVYELLENNTSSKLYEYSKNVATKSKDGKKVYNTSITFQLLKKVKVAKEFDPSGYQYKPQKISNADVKPFMKDINALVLESLRIMQSLEKNPNL
ncbi:MAG TPA: hypothetical protein VEV44_05635 [Pseudoneobacillus sp.]|nr:hypothetical protein [Pseudoneobacillus sp.]